MDRKAHQINKDAARAGVVLEFDGSKFTIASTNSNRWTNATARYQKKYAPALLESDQSKANDVMLEAAAEALLITWENVTDGGQPLEPTYENKLALLREAPVFREWVFTQARNFANFAAEADASDATACKSEA